MKRLTVIALSAFLLLGGCGGSKSGATLDDLQRSNEDLQRRVKSLEDQLLEAQKKQIQHDQALQAMAERIRDMENSVNKIQLGPAH